MSLQPKITDEAALRAAYPHLFPVNLRALKKHLTAAKVLGHEVPGAELEEVVDAPTEEIVKRVESGEYEVKKLVGDPEATSGHPALSGIKG